MRNKSPLIILSIVSLLLLIPLIAMQLTEEVNWTLADFIIATTLLISTGLTFTYITKKVKKPLFRIVLSVTLLIIMLLVWIELAVGIFKTY